MKYIGNKTRLLDFIDESLSDFGVPKSGIFIDIFSGTASVGRHFKERGYKIISNDFMTYSYYAQYVFIKMNKEPKFSKITSDGIDGVLKILNDCKLRKQGYVFNNYAPSGNKGRQYFSDDNAERIDAIRDRIENWKEKGLLSVDEYIYLVYLLIDSADFVANISGTYGAYLKIWRSMALKKIHLSPVDFFDNKLKNQVFNKDSNILINDIEGDIMYIDPPYNERQYASNFHVLESLAVWDKQELKGKTGLRDYTNQKSNYCSKHTATDSLNYLIEKANVKYLALSYNNEGIIPKDEIVRILNAKGKCKEYTMDYRRFRTEKDNEHRHYKDVNDKVVEHLYVVKCK